MNIESVIWSNFLQHVQKEQFSGDIDPSSGETDGNEEIPLFNQEKQSSGNQSFSSIEDKKKVDGPKIDKISNESIDSDFYEFMVAYLETAMGKFYNEPDVLRGSLDVAYRHIKKMTPSQRNFIEINRSTASLLEETIFLNIQKSIVKSIREDTLWETMYDFFDSIPEMNAAIQRLPMLGPDKNNLYRQIGAALTRGVVVPGVQGGEVLFFDKEKEIKRSIFQAYSDWGYMKLGKINIKRDSLKEYLTGDEIQKIEKGSPEEKRVLRNRLVIEAIASQLGGITYSILVIDPDSGNWDALTFDSEWFRSAYEAGQITVIESFEDPDGNLYIDDDYDLVSVNNWGIALLSNEDRAENQTGERVVVKNPIAVLDGTDFIFTISKENAKKLEMDVREFLWKQGDVESLREIQKKIPNAKEKIMKR